jgi:hypothetical protein
MSIPSCQRPPHQATVVCVVDADDVRRIALSLPHTVEIDSDGFDFRVGNVGTSGLTGVHTWSAARHPLRHRSLVCRR